MSMYTTSYPAVETVRTSDGWGPLLAGGVGGVIGYFVGRNNGFGPGCGAAYGTVPAGGQTVFQQGEYAGEARAADNFIAQKVNGLDAKIDALATAFAQQKITDQAQEISALKTEKLIQAVGCRQDNALDQILQLLSSVVTGCGVKSYPSRCGGNGCSYQF